MSQNGNRAAVEMNSETTQSALTGCLVRSDFRNRAISNGDYDKDLSREINRLDLWRTFKAPLCLRIGSIHRS